MGKIRMVELAKEKNLKVVDLLSLAKQLNVDAKNAMSSVSVEDAAKLIANLDKLDAKPKVSAKVEASKKEDAAPSMDKAIASTAKKQETGKATFEIGGKATSRPQRRQDDRYQRRNDATEMDAATKEAAQKAAVEKAAADAASAAKAAQNATASTRTNSKGETVTTRTDGATVTRREPRQQGGYQNRQGGQGGYQNREGGQGGYQNRQGGQGGYQNRQGGQGGYQNRQGGQGGYQNRQGGQGGYQNRQGGQGGYQNRQGGQGGYQNRQGGQGGYQNRQGGQGGYQNRQGGQGGYQNRQGGMDNRNIDRKLSDISAQAPVGEAQQQQQRSGKGYDNRNRRNYDNERKTKKQLREERRMEERRLEQQKREKAAEIERLNVPKIIKHKGTQTVGEISQQMGVPVSEIIKTLLDLGIIATINHMLDADAIDIVAAEFDATVEYQEQIDETDLSLAFDVEDDEENMEERPPVITIMGHVDHGKTTLLDALRKTSEDVTAGEAGGITQHIGAYQITHKNKKLTFLDTPGHEAFTSMRARGAQVTDIAIIVVAADDGVMPQTKEAVEHAQAAKVPIIVAVNKIDKPAADKTQVMTGLAELGLQSEEWGGDTIFVEISAKMGTNLDGLIEMIQLVAELEELKANPSRAAFGTVIEASLDKGKGSVATLLVQGGTLHVGDPIVVGSTHGRVRAMENDLGKQIDVAGPSMPIEVTGLVGVPKAGDQFAVFESEKKARQVGETRATATLIEDRRKSAAMNLEDLNQQILEGDVKEINILVKGDVQGSVEAVTQSFRKIDVDGVRVNIVRAGVGAVSETDVNLALASNAIIYAFNVRPDANAKVVAETEGVEIRTHAIIYKAIEEIESAMKGMLDPVFEETTTGQVEVRQLFKVSKIGTIAGCMVTEGVIKRESLIRLFREGVLEFEGKLGSLRRETNDAKSVSEGYECGLTIDGYNDLKEGDVIEAYEMQEVERA